MGDISKRIDVKVDGKIITDYTAKDLGNGDFEIILADHYHYQPHLKVHLDDCPTDEPVAPEPKPKPREKTSDKIAFNKDYAGPNLDNFDLKDPCFKVCTQPLLDKYDAQIPKAKARLEANKGSIDAEDWGALLIVNDLYRTEKNPLFARDGETPKALDEKSRFLPVPASGDLKNTLMRYSHWDSTLDALGLGKYKGKMSPGGKGNDNYYNGMTFATGVPVLLKLIRKDLGKKADGLSDVQVLRQVGANI